MPQYCCQQSTQIHPRLMEPVQCQQQDSAFYYPNLGQKCGDSRATLEICCLISPSTWFSSVHSMISLILRPALLLWCLLLILRVCSAIWKWKLVYSRDCSPVSSRVMGTWNVVLCPVKQLTCICSTHWVASALHSGRALLMNHSSIIQL